MYAVKKMHVRGDEDRRVRREVVAIACLQHRHIVRYYNAWYEDVPLSPCFERIACSILYGIVGMSLSD